MAGAGTSRQRLGWIVAAVVLVLLLGGAGLALGRLVSDDDPGADPAPAAASAAAPASPSPPAGSDIQGPLNILLVGIDTRVSVPDWQPHADAVLLLHVPAGLRSGYLYSLPRDLLVDVPAFDRAGFRGGRMKLTESMSRGAKVAGSTRADPSQGFDLLAATVSAYTGIKTFDAGAILTFTGFSRLTDALGGVTLTIDQKVVSFTSRPDGKPRTLRPGGGGYVGPQATYLPGTRRLVGWQALDYARQRYTAGGDYTRQRHHRQLIKALLGEVVRQDLTADPAKLQSVLGALGDTLTVDDAGRTPVELAYALRGLRPEAMTLVGLPGGSVGRGGGYRGEELRAPGREFLAAVAANRVQPFLREHPELVNR